MLSAEDTHIFNPRFINTFRAGFSRIIGDINTPVSGTAATWINVSPLRPEL